MKTWMIVVFLILLGGVLRLWQVGSVPPSPDWDEAALGYNAYSIAQTGKDEYGKFFPIVLRSFDDYKPALYSYLIIPFLFLFGLSIQAVRMPSILFGVATVVAVFFLCQELFHKKNLSFLIALFLAISPWHIQFSRIGFESNVGLSLNIFGLLFFIKGLKKPYFFFLSALFYVASLYVYQSEKVFVPLFIILLLVLFWNQVKHVSRKYIFGIIIFGAILVLPMALYLVTDKNSLARARGVSVFSDNSFVSQSSLRIQSDQQRHDYVGLLIDNRRLRYGKEIIANYVSHFDMKWLFLTGDVSRHHAPFIGLLYLWELPFLLLGIYYFLFSEYSVKTKILIFGWVLIAPVAASVTTGVPHAVRTLNFLPTFQIFTAFGLLGLYSFFTKKQKMVRQAIFGIVTIFALFNIVYYLDQYFVQQNYYNSLDWQYGYKDAVAFVSGTQYKHVVVSNQPPLDQSYMFFLFYLRYDPRLYQKETSNASGGFREIHQFGRYEFRPIHWKDEQKNTDTLYVGRPNDFDETAPVIKTIYYLNGDPAIKIVK